MVRCEQPGCYSGDSVYISNDPAAGGVGFTKRVRRGPGDMMSASCMKNGGCHYLLK